MKKILRYPGSKWKIASQIVKKFPSHNVYLEPFLGSGSIFLNKHKVKFETINDIDSNIYNLFKVFREQNDELVHKLKHTLYSRGEYINSFNCKNKDDVERARLFIVRMWQSFSPQTNNDKSGWSRIMKSNNPDKISIFRNLEQFIPKLKNRLLSVQIENIDALELIKSFDYDDCLIYIDPPYLLDNRTTKLYKHEYNMEQHVELLETITNLKKSKIVISSYDNKLYNNYLKDWSKDIINAKGLNGDDKREIIYYNYKDYKLF